MENLELRTPHIARFGLLGVSSRRPMCLGVPQYTAERLFKQAPPIAIEIFPLYSISMRYSPTRTIKVLKSLRKVSSSLNLKLLQAFILAFQEYKTYAWPIHPQENNRNAMPWKTSPSTLRAAKVYIRGSPTIIYFKWLNLGLQWANHRNDLRIVPK